MSRHDERERIRQRPAEPDTRSEIRADRYRGYGTGEKIVRRRESRTGRSEGGKVEPGERTADRWHLDALPEADVDHDADTPTSDRSSTGAFRVPAWLDEPPDTSWRDRPVPERFRGIRLDPGRRGVLVMIGVGLLAALVTAVVVLWERPVAHPVPPLPAVRPVAADGSEPAKVPVLAASSTASESEQKPASDLVVSVVGLVHRAGLIRLPPGSRVADALTAAGGVREGADLTGLNLAQRLSDGDQVQVGASAPDSGPHRYGSGTTSSGAVAGSRGSTADSVPVSGAPVDLNTATEAELDALPGIGSVTARAITTWRETNGRFTDIEQLGEVDGIGPTRLARLRHLVTV